MARTLLFAPFVPFIVTFCHVMETQDQTDLARLGAFVESIHAATTVSESAAKMHQLFHVLYDVAARYIKLHMQRHGEGESTAQEMDAQLAAIGFPNAGFWGAHGAAQGQRTDSDALRSRVTNFPHGGHDLGASTDSALPHSQ